MSSLVIQNCGISAILSVGVVVVGEVDDAQRSRDTRAILSESDSLVLSVLIVCNRIRHGVRPWLGTLRVVPYMQA